MGKLKALTSKIGLMLLLYGGWGLFGMSFLDSSILPLPAINDMSLIALTSSRPERWILYALASTLGSVCGAYVLFFIARAGGKLFFRNANAHSLAYAHRWLQRNEFVAILVTSLLPPPAPLKIFILGAGMLEVGIVRFGLALFVGRGLRFAAEAWLGAHYGAQAQVYIRHNIVWV